MNPGSKKNLKPDHQYLLHSIGQINAPAISASPFKWNVKPLDIKKMKEAYYRRCGLLPDRAWDDDDVGRHLDAIEGTCNEAIRKARPFLKRKPGVEIIWTPELIALRKAINF